MVLELLLVAEGRKLSRGAAPATERANMACCTFVHVGNVQACPVPMAFLQKQESRTCELAVQTLVTGNGRLAALPIVDHTLGEVLQRQILTASRAL